MARWVRAVPLTGDGYAQPFIDLDKAYEVGAIGDQTSSSGKFAIGASLATSGALHQLAGLYDTEADAVAALNGLIQGYDLSA